MKRGFTLIEIIGVLVLLGIVAVFSGMFLSSSVQRFSLEKDAAAMSQKTEAAMARIVKELTWADPASVNVTDGGRTVRWESRHPDHPVRSTQTLRLNGDDLLLDGQPLLDNVDLFEISDTVISGSVTVELRTTIQPTLHSTVISLRNDS